ncbi:MAG TPA: flagellar motor protein MotB [Leptospiraceae bacterium]|nr:flagellar motor protein MotB [Spirochaetaceae bacterium]HBS04527.1 flagellar motor protein MotB [Leptospiraceae bacterium]|tara:strand:+ start:14356 stop:15192 length:837 start_codon:yes stop_codon:yes gene_type:complete
MAKKDNCPPCEEGSPAWMTTYGDMVTLLLCFFVMLFATGKATPQEIQLILSAFSNSMGFFEGGQTLSKGRLEEMGMNLESLPSQTKGKSLARSRTQAQTIFKPEIQAKKVRITEDERGLVISLLGADYFEEGSAQRTPELEKALIKAASLLKTVDRFARIEGHAAAGEEARLSPDEDSPRRERTYANAWDLAGARSINSATFLQAQGVPPALMQVISYGSYRPLALEGDQGTPEAAAHNRRIDIVILPYESANRESGESNYRMPETRLPDEEYTGPEQ